MIFWIEKNPELLEASQVKVCTLMSVFLFEKLLFIILLADCKCQMSDNIFFSTWKSMIGVAHQPCSS